MKNIIKFIEGKKVLIWGMGREGRSTFNYIRSIYPDMPLTIADSAEVDVSGYSRCDFISAGEAPAFEGFDYIFKSPGIPVPHPERLSGRLTSQTDVFLSAFAKNTIGITGTKGKSTTSSLLYHLLKSQSDNTLLVGNIGIPCFDCIDKIDENTTVVFEMSCHQLEFARHSPHVGVVLNLYEEHLDHYLTMENYVRAKSHIFSCQSEGNIAILNAADTETLKPYPKKGRVATVCQGKCSESCDIQIDDATIVSPHGRIEIAPSDTKLVGRHNLFNIGICYYICTELFGMDNAAFKGALATFSPLAHRLQLVGCFGGVTYYDDSISTICQSAINAVISLGNVGTIILGGMDRGLDYSELAEFLTTADIDNVILVGQTTDRMYALLSESGVCDRISVHPCRDFAVGVAKAKEVTAAGKICLLSPAASSYDMFKNFEERGDVFQQLVRENNSGVKKEGL